MLENLKFFVCNLENKDKWILLGEFLDINVEEGYKCHANKSKK